MYSPNDKRRFAPGRTRAAGGNRCAARPVALLFPISRPDLHILVVLAASALAFVLSQGCAAVGVSLLGSATSAATGTSVNYTLDSKAQKTFTAPLSQVKTNVLEALGQMAFAIETDEQADEGRRIVARAKDREVEVQLDPVTPKATKIVVVVREGWFWKDRATAAEIVEQTSRGVDAVVLAARVAAAVVHRTSAAEELRPAGAVLDPWDPQRWREGFAAAPAPPAGNIQAQAAKPEPALPVAPVALPLLALGGGRAPAPAAAGPRPPVERPAPAPITLASVDTRPHENTNGDGGDNRWRILRKLRLRICPAMECKSGATLKKGDVVVRLREHDLWWRVRLAGTNLVGWVLPSDLAPQHWWDPPKRPTASAR